MSGKKYLQNCYKNIVVDQEKNYTNKQFHNRFNNKEHGQQNMQNYDKPAYSRNDYGHKDFGNSRGGNQDRGGYNNQYKQN